MIAEAQVLEVKYGLVEQLSDVRIVHRVDHATSIALTDNEPEVAQLAQLMRHSRRLHPDRRREFAERS